MMRFYEELPYEDIASIVGTSVGGLKANYFHAVRKIGEYLQASGRIISLDRLELAESE
jgi:RNA polymerase sigma-70 factor (ECF subfamily)